MKRIKELEAERDEREEEAEYWHGKWKEFYEAFPTKVDHEVAESLKAAANGLCGIVKEQDTRIAELEERIMELESELDG